MFKCQLVQCSVMSRGHCGFLSLFPSRRLWDISWFLRRSSVLQWIHLVWHTTNLNLEGIWYWFPVWPWTKSPAAAVHRVAVSLQGSSTTSFCGSHVLPGASHWALPSFPICKIGVIIPSIPFPSKFWLWNLKSHNIHPYLFGT